MAQIWKPGQSGNPAGRPAGIRTLVSRLHERLRQDTELADAVVDALVAVACQPAHPAWSAAQKLLWDRHDGALQEALAQRKVPDIVLVAAGLSPRSVTSVREERGGTEPSKAATNGVMSEPHPAVAPHTNGKVAGASQQTARRIEV